MSEASCVDTMEEGDASIMYVDEAYRMHGIGRSMVVKAMEALKEEKINKVSLIAFMENDIGNAFWNEIGWTKREDLNYYEFTLNEANITAFNK